MLKLLKETGIAAVLYFALSWAFGLGIEEGDSWPEAAMAAAMFAVLYFILGLALRWFKKRKS
ncbi:preprotein translocase subunit SecG [Sulfitobacter undariae]|uniref:Preprotein translocase subunit SecG n=1 Tax=Sulfitobacter undariae TaxID=1563671 RepID=A0A7W6E6U5_9RHOB|nr:hypothetical protein [Sulfitobacter undariae]MBB3995826.1 preprotein translocase subunit SecG [Sulfitobacter undariae]